MTTEHEASRTLVKSPPELWAECSDAGSLARHLGEFGEIRITRLEPESTVAWEGEHVSGTVRIEPSGWGTRVTLTAQTAGEAEVEAPASQAPPASSPQEGVPEASGESPSGVSHPDEEPGDATAEETLEDVDPEPLEDPGRARARWRRITARMRGLFAAPEAGGTELAPAVDRSPPETEAAPAPEIEGPEPPQNLEPPEPEPETDPAPDPATPKLNAEAVLTSALESLGQAHHRPFSRA